MEWVGEDLARLFFQQNDADQRHGYEAAAFVHDTEPERMDLVAAAALHDVGKRHANLGIIGRSVASLLILARLPLTERMRSYRDHGILGADELEQEGAPRLVVEFARDHHGQAPPGFASLEWDLLQQADEPAKARKSTDPSISSRD